MTCGWRAVEMTELRAARVIDERVRLDTETMRRAMARQAEAERDGRARAIHSLGEREAAENIAMAAQILQEQPAGMPLRTLGSLVDATSREGTVLVFPVPLELMRLAGGPHQG